MNKTFDTLTYSCHRFVPADRTVELYFSGCFLKCPGCQNPELQEITSENTHYALPKDIVNEVMPYVDVAKAVHVLYSLPLGYSPNALHWLLKMLKEAGFVNVILFTGYDLTDDEIKNEQLFEYCDYVKCGSYDNTNPNVEQTPDENTGIILATTNQRIVKVH